MDFERLKGQFDETIHTLERMWTEIGSEEGLDIETELLEQMQRVYTTTIEEVKEKKEQYVHDIQALRQEIATLAQLVHEPCPEVSQFMRMRMICARHESYNIITDVV